MAPSLMWWRRSGVQGIVERHFWSLTRYRIGRRFIGLDYADNVIFFPAYRKKSWGGWAAVTLGTTPSGYFTNDTSSANVLEDGYPLHWRASSKLQAFMVMEKKAWQAKRDEEIVRRTAERVAAGNGKGTDSSSSSSSSNSGSSDSSNNNNNNNQKKPIAEEKEPLGAESELHSEERFRDMLTIKCTSPGFAQRHLRLNRMSTIIYKTLYFYLWGIAISIIVQAYLMFRAWLNPPARAGLRNLEEHVLHLPKFIFGVCVSGVAWLALKMQPVVDPLLEVLEAKYPSVNWNAASPDSIASRAQHLVGNGAAAQQAAALAEARAAARRKQKEKSEDESRTWWTRVLMALLSIFSLLCVL